MTAGDTGLALPLMTLTDRKTSDRVRRLGRLATQNECTQFVVGLPREMDGAEGTSANNARKFAESLEKRTGLPVAFIDERLTSVEAESAMRLAGASAERRKELIDQMAAVIILQSWLDQQVRERRAEAL
ncbi:MAG: putative Holliday junction resolvase [Myxococcota bacterium]|jgi:putative Holliday junction resolvase